MAYDNVIINSVSQDCHNKHYYKNYNTDVYGPNDVTVNCAYLLKWNPLFFGIMCFACEQIAILRAVQPNNRQLTLDAQQLADVSRRLVHHLPSHKPH